VCIPTRTQRHKDRQGQARPLRGTLHTGHAVQVPQSSLVEDSKLLERMLRQVAPT
jgi:hypothetical protein